MSPLIFLAIPLLVFVFGSTALWLGSRWQDGGGIDLNRAPEDLRTVAPMLRDQRQTGWQSGMDDRGVRS